MSFDFAKMKKDQEKSEVNPTLMLLLAGPAGGGKSFAGGTFGVDTLFLHGETENHGADSIKLAALKKGKGSITVQSWVGGTPDENYKNLVAILTDPELPKHFGAVVLDGLKDLTFDLISGTTMFTKHCLTNKGEHNQWKEGEAILVLMKPIMKALFSLRKAKVHTVTTMILDIQDVGASGEILAGKPLLPTFGVAAAIIPQFDDRAVISFATPKIKGEEKGDHYLQFKMDMKRSTTAGATPKIMMIKPKLSGVDFDKLPEMMLANLEFLAKFKKDNMLK
tara:strand:+ start:12931 stop:13767 length:837 start_codon:yes stop_codon:yes gene_type:complete